MTSSSNKNGGIIHTLQIADTLHLTPNNQTSNCQ